MVEDRQDSPGLSLPNLPALITRPVLNLALNAEQALIEAQRLAPDFALVVNPQFMEFAPGVCHALG